MDRLHGNKEFCSRAVNASLNIAEVPDIRIVIVRGVRSTYAGRCGGALNIRECPTIITIAGGDL